MATYDPYQILPFRGYLDPETGERELHHSLAHFYHRLRLAGSDKNLQRFLGSIDCPDLFRIEVEGVGYSSTVENWPEHEIACLKAGLYMQAVEQKEFFSNLLGDVERLTIAGCDFSEPLATALSEFISSLGSSDEALKVAFAGEAPIDFAHQCFGIIFANKRPDCLFALEGDAVAAAVSNYARSVLSPLALIGKDAANEDAASDLARRCNHFFHFTGDQVCSRVDEISRTLQANGLKVTPIAITQRAAG